MGINSTKDVLCLTSIFIFSKSNYSSSLFTPVLEGKNHCFTGQVRNVRPRESVIYVTRWIQKQSQGLLCPRSTSICPFTSLKGPKCCSVEICFQKTFASSGRAGTETPGGAVDSQLLWKETQGRHPWNDWPYSLGNIHRIFSGCTRKASWIRGCCHLSPLLSQTGLRSDSPLQLPDEHKEISYDLGDSFLQPTSTCLLSWPPHFQCFFPSSSEFCVFFSKTCWKRTVCWTGHLPLSLGFIREMVKEVWP